jgi:hypothetical protein
MAHDTIPALEREDTTQMQEVVVNTDAVARTRRQPYNVIGIDTKGKGTGAKSLQSGGKHQDGVRATGNGGPLPIPPLYGREYNVLHRCHRRSDKRGDEQEQETLLAGCLYSYGSFNTHRTSVDLGQNL